VSRASRTARTRNKAIFDEMVSTLRFTNPAHTHKTAGCLECSRREDRIADLSHRVRQQNEQILGLQDVIHGRKIRGVFLVPAADKTLPSRERGKKSDAS
jgi:hypothetical protein